MVFGLCQCQTEPHQAYNVGVLCLPSGPNYVLICFPVPNPCKQVCSHLCLLRPGGYTCACPQGSGFLSGSAVACDAGEDTRCLGSLGAFSSPEDPRFATLAVSNRSSWERG